MHITTIVFFALLAFFTWRGYQKGFIGSITRVLGWIAAYPAAIVFTKPVAKLLMQHTALDGLIVYFIAGCSIFLLVSLLVSLLLNFLAALIPETEATQVGSKIGGVGVGVLMGALIGLLVVYAIGLVLTPKPPTLQQGQEIANAAQADHTNLDSTDKVHAPATGVPHVRDLDKYNDSFIEASAKKLVGTAAAAAVDIALEDKTATQIAKAFVEDPQTMLTHVQLVKNDDQMTELMTDKQIQSILASGDIEALTREPGFQTLMNNPSVQALLSQSNINSKAGSQAAAEKMVQAWSRAQIIKNDPRVIAIISDPEFQQQLNSSNKLQLMMNPKLNQLTEIIFNSKIPSVTSMQNYNLQDAKNPVNKNPDGEDSKPATTIYRWTDESGQAHYSDKPVKDK